MAELRDAGALGFTDDGKPVHRAGDPAQGAAVPAAVRRRARAARGGPDAVAAPASCTRARSPRGSGWPASRRISRVDDDRPRRGDRRLRGRPHPHPAPERARVGRGDRRGQGARRADHRRGDRRTTSRSPHEALLERLDTRLKMNPPLRARGRPPGADRRPARRHDRLHRHRPRAARARGEGGAVRGGADGHDRPGDRVRRGLHRARRARACCRSRWSSRSCQRRRARCSDLPTPRIAVGAPADLCLIDLEAEWEVGEAGYESRSENCCFAGRTLRGKVLATVAAGARRLPRAGVRPERRVSAPTSCSRTARASTATPSARPAPSPARSSSRPACRATRSR